MLLQPLVENSIKHGLSPKIGEGRITIRSVREKGHAIIDVIDNGVGVGPAHVERVKAGGIGLRNVNERLRVIYGGELPAAARQRARPGHVRPHRHSRTRIPSRMTA